MEHQTIIHLVKLIYPATVLIMSHVVAWQLEQHEWKSCHVDTCNALDACHRAQMKTIWTSPYNIEVIPSVLWHAHMLRPTIAVINRLMYLRFWGRKCWVHSPGPQLLYSTMCGIWGRKRFCGMLKQKIWSISSQLVVVVGRIFAAPLKNTQEVLCTLGNSCLLLLTLPHYNIILPWMFF